MEMDGVGGALAELARLAGPAKHVHVGLPVNHAIK